MSLHVVLVFKFNLFFSLLTNWSECFLYWFWLGLVVLVQNVAILESFFSPLDPQNVIKIYVYTSKQTTHLFKCVNWYISISYSKFPPKNIANFIPIFFFFLLFFFYICCCNWIPIWKCTLNSSNQFSKITFINWIHILENVANLSWSHCQSNKRQHIIYKHTQHAFDLMQHQTIFWFEL